MNENILKNEIRKQTNEQQRTISWDTKRKLSLNGSILINLLQTFIKSAVSTHLYSINKLFNKVNVKKRNRYYKVKYRKETRIHTCFHCLLGLAVIDLVITYYMQADFIHYLNQIAETNKKL